MDAGLLCRCRDVMYTTEIYAQYMYTGKVHS